MVDGLKKSMKSLFVLYSFMERTGGRYRLLLVPGPPYKSVRMLRNISLIGRRKMDPLVFKKKVSPRNA